MIAQLHRKVLTGDYARVLHKLSAVLGSQQDDDQVEEAKAIAAAHLGKDSEVGDEETTYDRLVYILWRWLNVVFHASTALSHDRYPSAPYTLSLSSRGWVIRSTILSTA